MPGDGERFIAAAPLPRLEDAERIGQPPSDRGGFARGRRTSVEDDDERSRRAVNSSVQGSVLRDCRPGPGEAIAGAGLYRFTAMISATAGVIMCVWGAASRAVISFAISMARSFVRYPRPTSRIKPF
jgi:hypothetical protein